jgi:uncharacterized protein with HEPN domain
VTLNQLFGKDSGMALKVINVLGEVCKQLVFVLQETNESVSWREFISRWKDVFGNRVKD